MTLLKLGTSETTKDFKELGVSSPQTIHENVTPLGFIAITISFFGFDPV
jgi:hypothetical protein